MVSCVGRKVKLNGCKVDVVVGTLFVRALLVREKKRIYVYDELNSPLGLTVIRRLQTVPSHYLRDVIITATPSRYF